MERKRTPAVNKVIIVIAIAAGLALLAVTAPFAAFLICAGRSGYHDKNYIERDGVTYRVNDSGTKAYVKCLKWYPGPENTDIYIPDSIDGIIIEGFSGYYVLI